MRVVYRFFNDSCFYKIVLLKNKRKVTECSKNKINFIFEIVDNWKIYNVLRVFYKKLYFFVNELFYIRFANSITSISFITPLSNAKRTAVRTVWNPDIPAAPGFTWRRLRLASFIIFKIWLWPQINSFGGFSKMQFFMFASYLPG